MINIISPWNLKNYTSLLKEYTELRAQENRQFNLNLMNGDLIRNSLTSDRGISARILVNGAWGFASAPTIDKGNIEKTLHSASQNAEFMSKKTGKIQIAKLPGASANMDLATKKDKLMVQELIERMREYDDYLLRKYPDLSHRGLNCLQQDFIKEGINSENAHTYSHYARSYLTANLGLNSINGPVQLRSVLGNAGQIEDTFPDFETFQKNIEKTYQQLKDKSQGITPEAGYKDVILSSRLAGILAHEAVGHPVEADLVLAGAVTADQLGQKVASDLVNLVDFAHTVYGKQAPMPVLFDDEGTAAADTVIIENGVLKQFMNNKQTAMKLDQKATGHARAWGFNDEPLIRMRNTAILPGKSKVEDMIASIDNGYFLIDHSNGEADSTSEFMFGVTMGYEIKKGKLGRALLDTTISGVAFDMLKTVSAVSDELEWVSYGTCGKKQPMTVGMGGPAIKCKIHVGGK